MTVIIPRHITGEWIHVVDDGMVDQDPYPDSARPTGHVVFEPLWPDVATADATAYTLTPITAIIAAGVLEDTQGREGVWLTGSIGESTVRWRATTTLLYQGEKIPYPTLTFDLDADARLTALLRSDDPEKLPWVVDPRIEGLIADAQEVLADAQAAVQGLEELEESAAGHAETADDRATAAGVSEANAKISETNAGLSEQAAAGHELAAQGFRDGSLTARDESRAARDQADGFRTQAGDHAATATEKATEAGTQAATAADFTTTTRAYRDQAEAARDIAVANGLTWRGTWAAGMSYAAQDVVTHAGASWRATAASTGVEPVEGASWSLLAARGAPGESGSVADITWADLDKPDAFPPEEHTHGPETLGSGGTRSGTTFLNGLGNWVTPYTVMSQAEAETGTDTTSRVLSAARLREVIHHRVTGAAGTAVSLIGQALNRATTKAEARSVLGAVADDDARLSDARTPTTHKHAVPGDLTTTGTASASTYLRGDGSWQTPVDTNTTYSVPTQAEAEAGTATTARAFSAQRVRQAIDARAITKQGAATGLWIGTTAALPTTGTTGVLYVTY